MTAGRFTRTSMNRFLFVSALLCVSSLGRADDLPPELKKEQARIESQINALEERLARIDQGTTEQTVKELRTVIKEFSIEAELLNDDPIIAKWNKRLTDLTAKAEVVAKEKAAKMDAAEKAKAEADQPKRDFRKEIQAMVKIPVDLNNVSFKKDVAPIVQNVCVRCHSAARAQGEFDASTYAKFMEHITPGKPEDSHILKLVTGRAEPRMPRGGQTRFDREWVEIWTNWIKQGAKFDGPSKSAPIANYMIDLESQRRAAIAALPEADLDKLHRAAAERHLVMVKSSKKVNRYETPNFLVMTTLPESEAEFIGVAAEATLEDLLPKFGLKDVKKFWKGRFGITVFADRLDYTTFAQLVDSYPPEPYEFGHARVTPEYPYFAMTADFQGATLDGMVAQLTAEGFLRQLDGGKAPPWVVYGYSSLAAGNVNPKDPHIASQLAASARLLASGRTFMNVCGENVPWAELAPLSAGFFHFLGSTNQRQAADFVKVYSRTGDWKKAMGDALGAGPAEVQRGWSSWTAAKGGKR
jgi:hypothetical protein